MNCCLMFGLWGGTAGAQLQLVADVNQTLNLAQSSPAQFTPLGAAVLFSATSAAAGRELWKTDGTTGGTVLLKDIRPGSAGSDPKIIATVGSVVYFAANDGVAGRELWKTDGTTVGTVLVKDIFPGGGDGCTENGIAYNGQLVFSAQDFDRNVEIWKSDGTAVGTVQIKDLQSNPVNPFSSPQNYTVMGSTLFFVAQTDASGGELWKTDGTNAGTVLVKDINPGSSGSNASPFAIVGSTLYFGATNSTSGRELWKSDGTTAGTVIVKDNLVGSGNGFLSDAIAVIGSTLYYRGAGTSNNGELWKSDGTSAGTVQVKEIRPSTAAFNGSDPSGFRVIGSTLYFFANDGTTGTELWKSDGSDAGTVQVKDIWSGSSSGTFVNATPRMELIGSTIYLYASDGISGGELWKSDGTDPGTVQVKDLIVGAGSSLIREMKAVGSKLYFSSLQSDGTVEPMVSDGSAGGTVLLRDIGAGTASSDPKYLTDVGGKLFFAANDGVNGQELWISDESGTRLVGNLNASPVLNSIQGMTNLNGTAFLGSSTLADNSHYLMWMSDGTALGTKPVGEGVVGLYYDSGDANFHVAGNRIFYTGFTRERGAELWVTDGTLAGSRLLKDITPGPDSAGYGQMSSIGDVLYFVVDDNEELGNELWRSDGTTGGTRIVKDIEAGSSSDPYALTPVGKTLYFTASGGGGSELFKTNGTAGGTVQIGEISPAGSAFPNAYTLLPNGTLLFSAFNLRESTFPGFYLSEGTELWRSNGTAAGTALVKDIRPGNNVSSLPLALSTRGNDIEEFTVLGDFAYFSAEDGVSGRELWRSDGTADGTTRVKDIAPGTDSSDPWNMVVVGEEIYFTVNIAGADQLWKTDGTEAGTEVVDDRLNSISKVMLAGEDLYVVGERSDVGVELFKLDNVRPSPFFITQSPASATVAPGASFTLTGSTTTVSGLRFQWRKDGIAIPGATQSSYTVRKATELNEGKYDLLIRLGTFEKLSDAAEIEVTDPNGIIVVAQPQSKLAAVGSNVSFTVDFAGQGPVTIQWFKGNSPVPGGTGATLNLTGVTLADAGAYRAKLTNARGSVTTGTATLAVVDTTDRFLGAKLNASFTIKAPVVGSGLTYLWLSGTSPLTNGATFAGVTGASLTIKKFTSSGNYRCLVTLGNQSLITGVQQVRAASVPLVTGAAMLPDWSISEWVNWPVSALLSQSNLLGAAWNAPTSFSVSGLPRGLRYDPVTMRIVGRPIAGGGGSVTIKIKATNAAGTSVEVSVVIDIIALPVLAAGEYRGLVDRNGAINGLLGNGLQVTITEVGGISGRLAQGTVALGFSGVLNTTAGSSLATANLSIPRRSAVPLQLNLNLNGATGVLTGSVTDGSATANATMVRCPWSKTNLTTDYAAAYTGVFQLQAGQVADVDYPQGEATLTATVSTAGMVSGAVRFADGVRTTFSVLLGGLGECALYLPGYGNTGSLRGFGTINSSNGFVDGTVTFYKAPQLATSATRSYKGGVPEHTLTLVGGEWVKPTTSTLLLGVTDSGAAVAADNAKVTFTSGGIESSGLSVSGAYVEQVRIKAPASGFVVPSGAGNPGGLKLSLNASTGEVSGEFATSDENPLISGKMIPRKAPFFGVIVQRLNQGRGHFNLAKLPAAAPEEENPAKTKVLSGLVKLEVLP